MSFKLFLYYCAVCGGWAAWFGWALGRLLAPQGDLGRALVQGLVLGMLVSLALSLVDALWSVPGRDRGQIVTRVGMAVVVGCLGGVLGAVVGQFLVNQTEWSLFVVVGWALTGLLIGVSIGTHELLTRFILGEALAGARRKIVHGILGGSLGGLLGSLLYLLLRWGLSRIFGKPPDELISGSATGFVALGACIGLFVGLAQVILKEAWIRVEAGFREGRELILSRAETTIGRGESCDIGLFGDPAVERLHARIVQDENRYMLVDAKTPAGTFVNEERLTQPRPLRSGDAIRVGKSVLRFGERPKPAPKPAPKVRPTRTEENPFA